ncbi:lipid-binding SYLF domain-containing protein [Gluconobacter wancherniae]|uniref:lipid-binding SYLF domain-containing protein n=1 Tax=Gluconobacter wancherniae TaxID=1307955 RepID=UPI001B8CDE34|nr:lipid-binding SYLF domain-containing protein [Gluconobacter wancherniae]MBS1061567.1 lipid-binding SYLF domain-containing protein [Gluconobacter wancherniae]
MTLHGFLRSSALAALGCTAMGACSSTTQTNASEQQIIVDRATLAVQDLFSGTTPTSRSQKLLAQAKAVMVCPSIFNMSIGLGGAGGRCVLMTRDARGSWSDPAFYRLSSGSLGLQLGMQDSEMIFFIMSQHGIQALLDSQFKFDANASASFATIGTGVENSTAGASNTDIYAAQKAHGLYAGVALGGSKLTVDSGANRTYYNQTVGPEDIIVTMRVNNPSADPLRRIMSSVAQVTPAATAGASSTVTKAATNAVNDEVGNNPYANYSAPKGVVKSQPLPSSGY